MTIYKNLLCCLSLLITTISFAQEIKFELFIKDNCNDSIKKVMYFNLRKDNTDFYPKNNEGVVILKDKGQYELSTIYSEDTKKYYFNDYTTVTDTITLPAIRSCLEPTSYPNFIGYGCCNTECNGNKTDYYANGNKLIEGYFEKGKPIGKLKKYYPNGTLKQIEKYNKKGKLVSSKKFKLKESK
ncbi:hypothetical protein [Flavobacterium microcysteis]